MTKQEERDGLKKLLKSKEFYKGMLIGMAVGLLPVLYLVGVM